AAEAGDRAERAVLGGMLRDNAVIGDVLQVVRKDDFRTDGHQKVFSAVASLYVAGKTADLVTVADALARCKQGQDIGGYQYLAELWDAVPTGAEAVHHAGIVRDHAVRRRLVLAAHETLREVEGSVAPADELVEQARHRIVALSDQGGQPRGRMA